MADEEEAPAPSEGPGVPAWVMTFADLMSLLLAFFVLLFSFSEMDKALYKQVGGSLKEAFGVQQDIKLRDPLKGLHFIPSEFSPGRPDPTKLNEIRQETTNVHMRYLLAETSQSKEDLKKKSSEVLRQLIQTLQEEDRHEAGPGGGGEKTGGKTSKKIEVAQEVLEALSKQLDAAKEKGGIKGETASAKWVKGEFEELLEEVEESTEQKQYQSREVLEKFEESIAEEQKAKEQFQVTAAWVKKEFREEIDRGLVDIEGNEEANEIILRISERASFPSGSADLIGGFDELIPRIGKVLNKLGGEVVVAGHTDDRPISTSRFRSNWELSSSRAVSVAHALMKGGNIAEERFLIEGYAHLMPIETNDTPEGRTKNRRVDIVLKKAAPGKRNPSRVGATVISNPKAIPEIESGSHPQEPAVASPPGTPLGPMEEPEREISLDEAEKKPNSPMLQPFQVIEPVTMF